MVSPIVVSPSSFRHGSNMLKQLTSIDRLRKAQLFMLWFMMDPCPCANTAFNCRRMELALTFCPSLAPSTPVINLTSPYLHGHQNVCRSYRLTTSKCLHVSPTLGFLTPRSPAAVVRMRSKWDAAARHPEAMPGKCLWATSRMKSSDHR